MPDIAVRIGTPRRLEPTRSRHGIARTDRTMNGLTLWFAPDEATRVARGDPRRSLAERYRDEAGSGTKLRAAALRLVAERYLLEEDVERVVEAAVARYRAAISQ